MAAGHPLESINVTDAQLDQAVNAAWSWLCKQAEHNFPDTTHSLSFPRYLSFTLKSNTQASDVFARATLANLLLDCAELAPQSQQQKHMIELAESEANYLATTRLSDRAGGWSYFSGLPELPPDADSLSTITTLFTRVCPQHLSLCERPLQLLLQQQREDGAFGTWLIAPEDSPVQRWRMHRGVKHHWRREIDADVVANVIFALNSLDPVKYAEPLQKARRWLSATQNADGSWTATWYWHDAWPAWLCLRALNPGHQESACQKTLEHLYSVRNKDGGWGPWQTAPLETAMVISLLVNYDKNRFAHYLPTALAKLLEMQTPEGRWEGTPWIRMPVHHRRPLSWSSDCVATAVCLRALLDARALI